MKIFYAYKNYIKITNIIVFTTYIYIYTIFFVFTQPLCQVVLLTNYPHRILLIDPFKIMNLSNTGETK